MLLVGAVIMFVREKRTSSKDGRGLGSCTAGFSGGSGVISVVLKGWASRAARTYAESRSCLPPESTALLIERGSDDRALTLSLDRSIISPVLSGKSIRMDLQGDRRQFVHRM
jgi:hypothetical protein